MDGLSPKWEIAMTAALEMREFCTRFECSIALRYGQETFSDGCKVADYARETAFDYWQKPELRRLGPEECAQSDMRHWHGV
jgi:hypothetical protein